MIVIVYSALYHLGYIYVNVYIYEKTVFFYPPVLTTVQKEYIIDDDKVQFYKLKWRGESQ